MKGDKEVRKLSKQESFGEQALYNEANIRTMTVKSVDDNVRRKFNFIILFY